MQILVPLATQSPFFKPEDYHFPKPLVEVAGLPMIERVVDRLRPLDRDARFIFVIRREDAAGFSLDRSLDIITDGRSTIVQLGAETQGSLCTCLMAIDDLDPDQPLIISNGDQIIDADIKAIVAGFLGQEVDAGVVTFDSVHPRWSYVRRGGDGLVLEAAEKRVISRHAIAGFYFFRTADIFVRAAKACIESGASHHGLYYIAPALNEIILEGGRVASAEIPVDAYHSFYSPAKIEEFEEGRILRSLSQNATAAPVAVQVVIPAAGEGSRFAKAGYTKPKPFIDVFGRPMVQHVIENVTPRGSNVHMLLRKAHVEGCGDSLSALKDLGAEFTLVDALTEGTACTLLLARSVFDNDQPLLVANSDQLVDFDVDDYVRDCIDRDLDGSILVFRDVARDPKWSFAKVDAQGLVNEVAEKKPISDLATVGIYLFRHGREFVDAAIDMIAHNDRVNNEFYTCPVYNYMIRNGARIGIYEVAPDAMSGLGTPQDLDAYLARRSG
jgi:NDP-sugar pyrophosphorylase family protein